MSRFFSAPMMPTVCTMTQLSAMKCSAKLLIGARATPPANRVPNRIGFGPYMPYNAWRPASLGKHPVPIRVGWSWIPVIVFSSTKGSRHAVT